MAGWRTDLGKQAIKLLYKSQADISNFGLWLQQGNGEEGLDSKFWNICHHLDFPIIDVLIVYEIHLVQRPYLKTDGQYLVIYHNGK